MAINDNQKLDFLWKKLGYGVTKTDINSIKNATNESIPSSLLIRGDKLWAEAGDIPATIPTSNTSQVELTSTETTSDLTASTNRTWKTGAADWIPPEFGSTYQVKVYIDSAGAANPQSTGTQLFAAGSGNNDEWFFDYQSGVLNFIGDNLPSGINGNKIYVVGARYIGNFGIFGTSDGIVEGSNNLYYTDERVDDRVANLFVDGKGLTKNYDDAGNLLNVEIDFTEFDTDDIVEGTVNTFLANRTTDDVVEGSNNLYYTDARVDTRIALQIGSNLDLSQKTTTDLTEGTNLYYTDARVDSNFATKTTTDLTEGTNLYYTEARFDTRLATKSTTDLAEGANLYFTEERVDDRVAALIQAGEDISVIYDDVNNTLTIALASSIDGLNLSNNTTDDLSEGSTNLYYTDSRVNIAFDTRLATKSTTDLSEGTNLYYTDARVDSNFAAKTTTDLTEGTNLYYTEARFDTRLATKSTTDLTEGTNLYYTDTRVATYLNNNGYTTTSAVAAQIASVLSDLDDEIFDREQADLNLQSQIDNLVLNDLTDVNASSPTSGDALVWNGTSWVPQAPFSQTDFDSAFAAKTTTDLTEGTNLYYTDARVRSHVEGQDLDLGSNKILFSNVYANTGDLPNASSYHGMFAHVHGTGKAYYAHAGNWIELANNTDLLTSTDDLPEGSTNLYYTDTRVRSAISATTGVAGYVSSTGVFSIPSSTDHISEGTNLYYTDTRFDARLATKSTTDLSEGTNLYYTEVRFDARLATKSTTDLTEGTNLYYTDARVDANIASKTTDDVAEGSTNLYYTDARVATYISGNRTYGNITTTGYIAGPATLTIDPAGVGDNTGKVVIAGDLQVDGTTTTINSTTVEVGDLNIVLGSGATNAAAANGGGITIDLGTDGSASFTYNSTTDEFLSNKDINANITGQVSDISNHTTTDLAEGTNLYYTQSRFDTAFGVKSTTDLTEGTNLYYTQSRFDTAFGVKSTTDLTEGTNLYYTDARVDSNFATKTTTDLTEGTNLYYTQARFDTAFATKDTDDLTEGSTNLYYTDARVNTWAVANLANVAFSGSYADLSNTPTDLSDFTDATGLLDIAAITVGDVAPSNPNDGDLWFDSTGLKTFIYYNDGTSSQWVEAAGDGGASVQSSSTAPSSPSDGDLWFNDNNLKLYIYYNDGSSAQWVEASGGIAQDTDAIPEGNNNLYYTDTRVDTRFATKDTDDLPEGSTNLYYTDARVNIAFDTRLATKSTTDLTEGTNLYYTDARVDSNFATKSTTDLTEGTNLYYTDTRVDTRFATKDTDDLVEGSTNLYYTDARVDARIASSSLGSTDDLPEGSTNLYYTDARVQAVSINEIVEDITPTLGGNLNANTFNITNISADGYSLPVADGANRQVIMTDGSGTLSFENLDTIHTEVTNQTGSTILKGTPVYQTGTSGNAMTIAPADASSSATMPAVGVLEQDLVSGATGFVIHMGKISGVDTSAFNEGDTIYVAVGGGYTNTPPVGESNLLQNLGRVTKVHASNGGAVIMGAGRTNAVSNLNDGNIFIGDSNNQATTASLNTSVQNYLSNLSGSIVPDTNVTYDLGSNTNRFKDIYLSGSSIYLGTLQLSDNNGALEVTASGSTEAFATETYVDTAVANLVDSSPTTLDTLNELAAALGDDPNFSTTITNLIGTKLATADFNTTADSWLTGKTTADLTEGTNLYYTDARVDARIAIQTGANLSLANKTTDDLSEGSTNLYYTEARVDANIASKDTGDLAEGSNLYYTEARVDANIASKDTGDLAEGSNLYYTDARVQTYLTNNNYATVSTVTQQVAAQIASVSSDLDDEVYDREQADINLQSQIDSIVTYSSSDFDTDFAGKSTTDLTEGTNLYYTDTRVRTHIQGADLDMGSNKILFSNVYANTGDLPNASSYHGMFAHVHGTGKAYYAHNGQWVELANQSELPTSTDELSEGSTNLYYTEARVDANIATKDTGDLAEGSNLYYTDARVQTKLGSVSGHIIPDTDITYDLGSSTNKFRDLYLSGSSITLGTIELTDNGGALEVTPIGGGSAETFATETYVDTAVANLVDIAPTTLDTLNELAAALGDDPNFSTTITNLIGTKLATADFNTTADTWIGTKSTSDLTEGSNLYYTESRVDARIALQSGSNLDLSNKDTDDLSEGSTNLYYTDARTDANLYFTDERVDDRVANLIQAGANVSLVYDDVAGTLTISATEDNLANNTTDDLAEGSNLYYTDARVDARITASNPYDSSDFDANFSGKSTTDLTEGTNLYYTDARVRDQLYSTVSVTTSSGSFYIDGEQQGIVTLQPGRTYRFDQSDASNNSHPLRFSEVPDGTHAGGGATAYTTGVTVNGTAGNAGAYVEFVVTNATPRLYYYCANHSGMGGKVSVGKEMFVERITSDTWITGPIQTTTLNLGTGGSINAALGTMDFSNSTVIFSGANITGLSNSDVGLANIADNAQGVVVNGKVAAGSLDIGTSGSINAQLATLDFRDTLVNFSGATVSGLDDTIQDEVDFHLNKNNSSGATIISDGEILSWNATGGLQGTGDYEWINLGNEINSYLSGTGYATTSYVAAQIASVSSDLDDEVYDREQADLNLQSQIDSLTTNIGTLVLDDLSDVDTTTTAPTNGQTLIFNGTTFVPGTISGYTSTDFDTDFATKSTTDLSEGTNLYYTDARVRTHIQGTDLDMGSNKILFSNVYANIGDLPSASSYHGMFAHVHGTGKAYYAHAGNWIELANQSELPTSTDDVSEGSTNLYYTDARFDARLATKSTTDISEGTNLYYTDARVDARITASNPYDSSMF